jgi:hypothetical protein
MKAVPQYEVETQLRTVLGLVQELGGHEVQEITAATKPIGDLMGFDSLTGAEATTLLAQRLGSSIGLKRGSANVFVSPDGCRALTVREIADRLVTLIDAEKP